MSHYRKYWKCLIVLAMTIMQKEAVVFGLQINWSKTKILQVPPSMSCSTVQVADGHVEMVDAFVYLGSMIDSSGGSRGEVLRRIGIARSCMNLLEKKNLEVMHQAGYQNTPLPDIHSPCLVVWVRNMVHNKAPVLDAFDMWALRKILRIPYTRYVTNVEVRATTGCRPLSHLVTDRRLRLLDILPAAHHKRTTTVLSLR